MPYIPLERRKALWNASNIDRNDNKENPGELNYMLTILIQDYLKYKGLSYTTINDVVGALDNTKSEFYRRIAVPYEDLKIKENGDVYDLQLIKLKNIRKRTTRKVRPNTKRVSKKVK